MTRQILPPCFLSLLERDGFDSTPKVIAVTPIVSLDTMVYGTTTFLGGPTSDLDPTPSPDFPPLN